MEKKHARVRYRLDLNQSKWHRERADALPELPEAEAHRSLLAAQDAAVAAVSAQGDLLYANPALLRLLQSDPSRSDLERNPRTVPEGAETLFRSLAPKALQAGRCESELRLPLAGVQRVLRVVAVPFEAGDRPAVAMTFYDISRQLLMEQQAEQLMREVEHRVKNTLALVLSISNRTASSAETVEGFRTAFSGRMRALAETHNTLAERSWSSILLADIIKAELRPFPPDVSKRVHLKAQEIALLPRAAIALGLIIHELAANAVRFGALSAPEGRVDVELLCEAGRAYAELKWLESGGPPVSTPGNSGFGQTVITRSLQYSPAGGADLDFLPEGIRCRIRIPMEDLA
ncbi:HWE histidine kinase domain-containing protein [Gellertiella hungarica]|uniref:histidine kinase n=1 Tax=Gellertiella hungarica TaxID=1572859 RepID=A0A7W6NL59_9HYPH|nr:two-component sensor histidine kinase [Gellertiella hungarica]